MRPFVRPGKKQILRFAQNDNVPTRSRVASLLLLLGVVQLISAEALPPAWEHWRYWRALELPPAESVRLMKVTLPIEVYERAQPDLGDLRLTDDTWAEVPYVLHVRRGSRRQEQLEARLGEVSFVPGPPVAYTQAQVDLGEKIAAHNQLTINTDEKDFFARVELAVSDDAKNWRLLRQQAPIYRFQKDGLPGNQTISYSESRARYLRLRIDAGEKPFPVSGASVSREVVEEAELAKIDARFSARTEAPRGRSWWQADLGSAAVPASQVRFSVGQSQFHRAVEVYTSNDAQRWRRVGQGDIYRPGSGDAAAATESLRTEFEEARGGYWRVVVVDRNDPPLAEIEVELWGTPRHLVFRQEPRRSYRLLYGNERAEAPQYELARLLGREEREQAAAAAIGAEMINPSWADPRPWSERHPVVLWIALGIAVVALGLLALRSLRQAR